MVLVKILGIVDLIASFTFLLLVFGIQPYLVLVLFSAGLLLIKGLLIFTGEIPLSLVDLFSALMLLLSLAFALPSVLLWIPAFLLLAKGIVSFM